MDEKNLHKIALFMGAAIDGTWYNGDTHEIDHYTLDMGKDRSQNERYWASNTLKYHKDWNWLMPVIEKIEKEYHYEVSIIDTECDITITGYRTYSFVTNIGDTKINGVYKSVVEFIELANNDMLPKD